MDASRITVLDHADQFLFEIASDDVFERRRVEEINGEHSLTLTTTRVLEKEQRLLTCDETGKWREYVVMKVDEAHQAGDSPVGTYWCPWSLMHDLAVTRVDDKRPGVQSPVSAGVALDDALELTARWTRGTVTRTSTGGASLYRVSAYQALGTITDVWGGEVDATIDVSPLHGVTARRVDLYEKQGDQDVHRRFDWSKDMTGIARRVSENPVACRIVPLGKGEQTESGGFGRKITIESANGGIDYLQNDETAPLYRLPNGTGGWEYPTVYVENSQIETPADLKEWGLSVLEDYTTPQVTYQADVVQLAQAGLDPQGLALGDAVHCVDRGFPNGGLRVKGRVTRLAVNELDPTDIQVTIGHIEGGIAGALAGVSKSFSEVYAAIAQVGQSAAEFLDDLLGVLNEEINANGGYFYITDGQGVRCYDRAVSDPLVGSEATQVVEIKGGSIRIANSRTSSGQWNWKTVFVSGHIAAELVTAVQIIAGFIGDPNGDNYWDLDNQFININKGSILADLLTAGRIQSRNGASWWDLDSEQMNLVGYLRMEMTYNAVKYYAQLATASWNDALGNAKGGPALVISRADDNLSRQLYLGLRDGHYGSIVARSGLEMAGGSYLDGGSSHIDLYPANAQVGVYSGQLSQQSSMFMNLTSTKLSATAVSANQSTFRFVEATSSASSSTTTTVTTRWGGSFTVWGGTKSRLVFTDDYSERLLYCYETPTPMFGDVGSGVIGEDGLCYVEIDAVFAETVMADKAYQVFLQKCGPGDCWVAEKHPTHFVVEGTPGLKFDWEMKARQESFGDLRLEDDALARAAAEEADDVEMPSYDDYLAGMEELYEREKALVTA